MSDNENESNTSLQLFLDNSQSDDENIDKYQNAEFYNLDPYSIYNDEIQETFHAFDLASFVYQNNNQEYNQEEYNQEEEEEKQENINKQEKEDNQQIHQQQTKQQNQRFTPKEKPLEQQLEQQLQQQQSQVQNTPKQTSQYNQYQKKITKKSNHEHQSYQKKINNDNQKSAISQDINIVTQKGDFKKQTPLENKQTQKPEETNKQQKIKDDNQKLVTKKEDFKKLTPKENKQTQNLEETKGIANKQKINDDNQKPVMSKSTQKEDFQKQTPIQNQQTQKPVEEKEIMNKQKITENNEKQTINPDKKMVTQKEEEKQKIQIEQKQSNHQEPKATEQDKNTIAQGKQKEHQPVGEENGIPDEIQQENLDKRLIEKLLQQQFSQEIIKVKIKSVPFWATAKVLKPKLKQFFQKNQCKLLIVKCLDFYQNQIEIDSEIFDINADNDDYAYNNSYKCNFLQQLYEKMKKNQELIELQIINKQQLQFEAINNKIKIIQQIMQNQVIHEAKSIQETFETMFASNRFSKLDHSWQIAICYVLVTREEQYKYLDDQKIEINIDHNKKIYKYTLNTQVYLNEGIIPIEQQLLTRELHDQEEIVLVNVKFGYINESKKEFQTYFDFYEFNQNCYNLSQIASEDQPVLFFQKKDSEIKENYRNNDIIIPLLYNCDLKIQFSNKLCKSIQMESLANGCKRIYFSLLVPPQFFIYIEENNQSQPIYDPVVRRNWVSIPNIFLVNREPVIDELLKLMLIRNTTICIEYAPCKQMDEFINSFSKNKLQLILQDQTYYNHSSRIKLNFFTNQELSCLQLKNWDEQLSYYFKYLILCLLTDDNPLMATQEFYELLKDITKDSQLKPDIVIETFQYWLKKHLSDIGKQPLKDYFMSTYNTMKLISKIQLSNPIFSSIKRLEITPSGIRYLPSQAEVNNRILRRYKNQSHLFYRINCVNEQGLELRNMQYISKQFFYSILNGMTILGKRLCFLAFSASQLRTGQCWFLEEDGNHNVEDFIKNLGNFSNIYPAAKRAARIGQLFSTSLPVRSINMSQVNIVIVEDLKSIKDKTKMFSDGIGMISSDLIKKVYTELIEPKNKISKLSAIQIRYAGVKGVLAEKTDLQNNTIILRESMVKFDSQPTDLEVLEFNKYRPGFLNRQIIILLSTLGVPNKAFKKLQEENIKDLENCNLKDANIYRYFMSESSETIEIEQIQTLLRRMINAGIDTSAEPFFLGVIETLRHRAYQRLKTKCNILVKKAARLLGVLDEFGILKENEIFVAVCEDNVGKIEYINGKVFITKNPCIHPGDIRKVDAVDNETTRKYFGHLINCIVFPQKGSIPLTSQISGSDLDGDQYFVSWDDRLIPSKNYRPFNYDEDKKQYQQEQQNNEITQNDYLNFFLDYQNQDALGSIANSHLAFANWSKSKAFDKRCLKLAQLHSEAVDFAKTGRPVTMQKNLKAKFWPDFMEKKHQISYETPTVLGILYREMKTLIKGKNSIEQVKNNGFQLDKELIYPKWETYIKECCEIYKYFAFDLELMINDFGIQNEFEIYSGNFSSFNSLLKANKKKNSEFIQKRIVEQVMQIKEKISYKFYGNQNNDIQDKKAFKAKASALYIISYSNYFYSSNQEIVDGDQFQDLFISNDFQEIAKECKKYVGCPWLICSKLLVEIKKRKTKDQNQEENEEDQSVEQDYQDEDII